MDPRDMTYKQLRRFVAKHDLTAKSQKRHALEAAVSKHQKLRRKVNRKTGAPIEKPPKRGLPPLLIDRDGTPLTARRARPYRNPLPIFRQ